ncbi:MAG: hypothetical protein WC688_05405 [Parachlamydiales bacterium]|jgi:hypothetical protein
MKNDFKIIISSDLSYEELCAEIYFDDQFVAILTQEEGFENLMIEIYPPENKKMWLFKFSEFEKTLITAKEKLWKMREKRI